MAAKPHGNSPKPQQMDGLWVELESLSLATDSPRGLFPYPSESLGSLQSTTSVEPGKGEAP